MIKRIMETKHTSQGFFLVEDCVVCDPLLPVGHLV